MKKALLATLCVLAAGCTTRGQVNPDVMQIATTPLTCSNTRNAASGGNAPRPGWRSHSNYKIESATDTLIQTAGPDGGKRALAYQITRTSNNDGTATSASRHIAMARWAASRIRGKRAPTSRSS